MTIKARLFAHYPWQPADYIDPFVRDRHCGGYACTEPALRKLKQPAFGPSEN